MFVLLTKLNLLLELSWWFLNDVQLLIPRSDLNKSVPFNRDSPFQFEMERIWIFLLHTFESFNAQQCIYNPYLMICTFYYIFSQNKTHYSYNLKFIMVTIKEPRQ